MWDEAAKKEASCAGVLIAQTGLYLARLIEIFKKNPYLLFIFTLGII